MNFKNNEVRKVIYYISTRWLSLRKCLARTLIQWYPLKSYFMSNFNLDDDPTENDPDEKSSREKRLVNAFKQPVSKLYAMFVQSVTPILDSFNTFLQAEETLIIDSYTVLYHSTLRLYRSLLSNIYPTFILSDDVLSIDVEDPDVSKDFNSGFIGAMAKQYPRDSDIIITSEYKKLLKEVLKIFPLNVQSTCKHQFQS